MLYNLACTRLKNTFLQDVIFMKSNLIFNSKEFLKLNIFFDINKNNAKKLQLQLQ